MSHFISKGGDRPEEMMGVKGMQNLYVLAGGVGGGMLLTMIAIIAFSVPPAVAFGVFGAILVGGFFYLVGRSRKYGENGVSKAVARRSSPGTVTVRSARCYYVR